MLAWRVSRKIGSNFLDPLLLGHGKDISSPGGLVLWWYSGNHSQELA